MSMVMSHFTIWDIGLSLNTGNLLHTCVESAVQPGNSSYNLYVTYTGVKVMPRKRPELW